MILKLKSMLTGKMNSMEFKMSEAVFMSCFERFKAGASFKEAFKGKILVRDMEPYYEFLMTGISEAEKRGQGDVILRYQGSF